MHFVPINCVFPFPIKTCVFPMKINVVYNHAHDTKWTKPNKDIYPGFVKKVTLYELRGELGNCLQGANKSPPRSGRRAKLISGA